MAQNPKIRVKLNTVLKTADPLWEALRRPTQGASLEATLRSDDLRTHANNYALRNPRASSVFASKEIYATYNLLCTI